MFKKILVLSVLVMLSACSSGRDRLTCPKGVIMRADSYIIQKSNVAEEFMIELIGYEGYCYYDSKGKSDKAVLTPVFSIKRLSPSNITDINFSYYAETKKGGVEYKTRRSHTVKALMPKDVQEIIHNGKAIEVRVPANMKHDFDINLGLVASSSEKKYNQRTFDVRM